MVISDIQSDIRAIEEDAALHTATNFDNRANAIDFIDFHIIDRIDGLLQTAPLEELAVLRQRAVALKSSLEAVDTTLFAQLREQIRRKVYTGPAFLEMIRSYTANDIDQQAEIGYDNLDIFINRLLSDQDAPAPTMAVEPEMVFYQKTPARIIFEMMELAQLQPGDVFFDLGSGLGQVAILAHLISGVSASGIEYEPAYCSYANTCAEQLNLNDVRFIPINALQADYAAGNVFFMYTPFEGAMLQSVLDILQAEAQRKTITIFSYGPCSSHVARQSWLSCINGEGDDLYKLYEFRSVM
ncbi:hypothetical protein F0L74_00195 [Chitinophaga agrisoli]|uniref:DOT1 domain-containing protein n=1 Tax=Chitinophaga agrisoli TaxID=2607653 RepID=A0A5B2VX85_9BACT|nr:hypothetical protein [Chitinophaga agrisoli]KAA2244443.1 hypothetical protein F0L74_00195 [Chitinophaga agrisoli]